MENHSPTLFIVSPTLFIISPTLIIFSHTLKILYHTFIHYNLYFLNYSNHLYSLKSTIKTRVQLNEKMSLGQREYCFSSRSVMGGVSKVRERIHRRMSDRQLLAIPASCSQVAA